MYKLLPFAKELRNFVSSEFYNVQLSKSKQINNISVCAQKYITILNSLPFVTIIFTKYFLLL